MESIDFCIDSELRLRPFEPVDTNKLFELTDKNRTYFREWLPWLDSIRSSNDTFRYIKETLEHYEAGASFQFGIWYKHELVGGSGYNYIDKHHQQTAIGYWLSQYYQGHGIITRATQFLTEYAFNSLHLHRVEIRCATGNKKSRAIPERLSFVLEGILRDAQWLYDHFVDIAVYSKLSSD